MKVVLTAQSRRDLGDIQSWISADSPAAALRFVRSLRESCLRIGRSPSGYIEVDHDRYPGLRRNVHGAYLIYFQVHDGRVSVQSVVHGARDQERILETLPRS